MASLRGASSIVDKWLADDEATGPVSRQLSFLPHNSTDIGKERKGLGFKAAKPGQSANRSSHENALALKLEKSNKKRKAEDLNNFDLDIGSHGVADDFDEESRISATGKSRTAAKPQQLSQLSVKAKSKPLRANNKLMMSEVLADPDLSIADGDSDTAIPIIQQEQNEHLPSSPTKRKRKKTRSKQKNIRRDNRPDHARPQHLQFGTQEYTGRPLTQSTKAGKAHKNKKSRKRRKFDYLNGFSATMFPTKTGSSRKFTKEVGSQMGAEYYFDSETPVANAVPVDYEMKVDEDFAEILHILEDDVMDDSPIAYPVASATTFDSAHSAHVVTAFPCFEGDGKTDEFDGFYPQWVENMDLDELQSFHYLQDIVEDDEERKVNAEDLMESTSAPCTNNNNYLYPPAIQVKSSDEVVNVDNSSANAPPWERDDYNNDMYSQSQSMQPVYDHHLQSLPPPSRRSFYGYVKDELVDSHNNINHKVKKNSTNKKGPSKTKEPPSSNSSMNLSRRQSATAQREREQGRFKKATCNWVSVTDLFEQ